MKNVEMQEKQQLLAKYMKSIIISKLIKSGILLDYALPFIVSGIIAFNIYANLEPVYVVETKGKYQNAFSIDEDKLKENTFIYSTAWHYNDENSVERTEITYRIDKPLELNDAESLINMTEEELNSLFKIETVKTIKAKNAKDIDSIYRDEMLIIPEVLVNGESKLVRTNMSREKSSTLICYLIAMFISGLTLSKVKDILTHTYVRDYLTGELSQIQKIKKDELESLHKLFQNEKTNKKQTSKRLNLKKINNTTQKNNNNALKSHYDLL